VAWIVQVWNTFSIQPGSNLCHADLLQITFTI
jgi:hypothetical protein